MALAWINKSNTPKRSITLVSSDFRKDNWILPTLSLLLDKSIKSSNILIVSLAIRIGPTGIGVVAVDGINAIAVIPAFKGGIDFSEVSIILVGILITFSKVDIPL